MDFFSGSATTAHAVLDSENKYKYIMVQLDAELKDDITSQKAAKDFLAAKGLPCTLDQIGIERIKRAAAKILKEHPGTTADLGFKHFTLKEAPAETLDKLEKFNPNDQEIVMENNILDDFGKQTVLTTWLVRDGYGFTAPVQEIDFAGYKGYYIDKHLYLIDADMSKEAVAAIVDRFETDGSFSPENVVLFGYSFVWTMTDALKTNLLRLKDTEKNLRINFDVRY